MKVTCDHVRLVVAAVAALLLQCAAGLQRRALILGSRSVDSFWTHRLARTFRVLLGRFVLFAKGETAGASECPR